MTPQGNGFKDGLLKTSRRLGLFKAARRATRQSLRILCYHGFATDDALTFRPGLFISPETFERRLRALSTEGYPVMTLQSALRGLERGNLPDCATVITIDDVFQGFVEYAVPLLRTFGMPVTAYVTTYYSLHREPVFRLVIRYMFWKTLETTLRIVLDERAGQEVFLRHDRSSWWDGEERVIAFGEGLPTEADRTALATRLGQLLNVGYDEIVRRRMFNVVTPAEVGMLASNGIDIQLHTHRHRLPERQEIVEREIADNRSVLEPLVGARLEHLCYPSGIWSPTVWPWLIQCGIVSATTCDPGLNDRRTPKLALKRILDSEGLPHIRFEAEMSGFKHLARLASAGRRKSRRVAA